MCVFLCPCVRACVGTAAGCSTVLARDARRTTVGGENRPVIRSADDSRCYVNIPTALLPCEATARVRRAAASNIWFSVQDWHAARVCVCVECGVCRFGADDPRWPLSSPLGPPTSLSSPSSQITAVAQWLLAVAPRCLAPSLAVRDEPSLN